MQVVSILRATAGADMPEVYLKAGDTFYMARDGESTSFRVVKWDRVRWVCSCGQGKCDHKLMVNDFLTEEFQKRLATEDDLGAHIEDELRSHRQ
jgi:hypothetical protein